ncbi:MAG: 4'-phosphopantetheinyl transferase family protein [Smithellaceae bacterium]
MDLRFLKKILTDTEIEQIHYSGNPEAALWSFWACKEAAYKVIRKKNNRAAFVPRRWSVRYQISPDSHDSLHHLPEGCKDGEVAVSGSGNVHVRLFTFPSYVHCTATDTPEAMNRIVARVDGLPELENPQLVDPSSFVRLRLSRCLADNLFLPEESMRIVRKKKNDGLGQPLLYISGIQSDIDISISHDGRYVSYAYLA